MAEIRITVEKRLSPELKKALKKVPNFQKIILDAAAASVLTRNKRRFLQGVDPNGKKWQESQSAKRRAAGQPDAQGVQRKGSAGNTLFSTGSLFFSLQAIRSRAKTNQRTVGVNPTLRNRRTGVNIASYAVKHAEGKGGQVKRIFLGINKADASIVERIIKSRVDRELGSG